MEETDVQVESGEIINLAYYFIFGASLLMHRFQRLFDAAGFDAKGTGRLRLTQAKASLEAAIKQIDLFDADFLAACRKDGSKWDAFFKVTNELIGLDILYIHHSYEQYADALKVIELVKSQGQPNAKLDELAQGYLTKAIKG